METLGVLELSRNEFEDSVYKNNYIAGNASEYIAFVDGTKMTAKALVELVKSEDMLSYGNVFVVCAGESQDAIQLPLENVLECFSLEIVALIFRRNLVATCGNFNSKLRGMTNYEMLCRLAERNGSAIFVFPGMKEEDFCVTDEDAVTCAYLLRRYLKVLKDSGKIEMICGQMNHVMEKCGVAFDFRKTLNLFFNSDEDYNKIAVMTAPFVIFQSPEICFGVLQDFVSVLKECLHNRGQACVIAGEEGFDYNYLMNHISKALIGFQTKAFAMETIHKLPGIKMQFWFDNPVTYEHHFMNLQKECFVLCHDANYVNYIKNQFEKKNALVFPPAGHWQTWKEKDERPYDIVFIGQCFNVPAEPFQGIEQEFYEYMIEHPDTTFLDGLQNVVMRKPHLEQEYSINEYFAQLKPVCQRVIDYYRCKVVDTILEAGYEIHVYGDSWKTYHTQYSEKLICHSEVSVRESLGEWQKAKIGLNVMSWHKAGMTERIANIMLAGAVCLSEETTYIKEHFEDNQIVTYKLSKLNELPQKIETLLKNDAWKVVARNGYEIASREHTWECRTKELVELVETIVF